MNTLQELNELIEISRFYGSNKDFVLAGGGNTSFKNENYLWIKASGTSLATIDLNGFAQLSRKTLQEIELKSYSDDPEEREHQVKEDLFRAMENPTSGLRPSVETSLHNLVNYPFVVHLHPWLVNALLCSRNSKKIVHELFGDEVLYVPYTDPGHTLFQNLRKEVLSFRNSFSIDPQIIMLENHGIFVAADNPQKVKEIYENLLDKIRKQVTHFMHIEDLPVDNKITEILPAIRMLLSGLQMKTVCIRNNTLINHFGQGMNEARKIISPFTPDIIVYCKAKYIYIEHTGSTESIIESFRHQLDRFRAEFSYDPKIILIKDLGLITVEDSWKQAQTAMDVYEDMMKISYYAEIFGGQRFLSPEQITFIDNWEVENYRRKVAAGNITGRMEAKTVIVTGGAMGFGAGIAEQLFEEKANIVIADINAESGKEFVDKLNEKAHKNHSIFIQTDVSNSDSVQNLIYHTVAAFGGIDLFVSNAGILKAGSLEEIEPENFEVLTKVNYEGYFLCTKYASRVMKQQSKFHPTHFMDIIQINSKSGLRGSNKNFAYAGGKFGGIGLTQSFALELIPYRIKVNAICPGNFFEGPLWSDPKTGLFVQYLKAGKVPGAHTIEDVKKYYESQVPAGRGCRVEDVMKAIYYIVDQEYETGQAIPVTGGQVMLS